MLVLRVAEYSPAEVKRAVVGYGRAEKQQVQTMVMLLLGLATAPSQLDISDALAVAICHAHTVGPARAGVDLDSDHPRVDARHPPRSWRRYRPGNAGSR